jgi:arylsulfatase A-like enzyme
MNIKNTLLISKDVLRADYLSCYGSNIYKTPNIDKLAYNGTIFTRFYTAAPSSGMAYTAMFSGMDIYQMNRKYFGNVRQFDQCTTLFQDLETQGYATHVIWDKKWYNSSRKKAMVFSNKTMFHNLEIAQHVGPHATYDRDSSGRIIKKQNVDPISDIIGEIIKICKIKGHHFIWLHCPHCFIGCNGYGTDINVFDTLVGNIISNYEGDIFLTADHGHMNGEKGFYCYGFHVYEGAVHIPLITPNYFNKNIIDTPYSNIQIKNLILERKLKPQPFIYSDSQYYLQLDRKLMIIKEYFKYIFNKHSCIEELYDLAFDPHENINLLQESVIDKQRLSKYYLDEVFYYSNWNAAKEAYKLLRKEKERIWRTGTTLGDIAYAIRDIKSNGLKSISNKFPIKSQRGRWGSRIQA